MMSDRRAAQVFQIDPADHDRYGQTQVGDGCILARNLVEADAGTHFVIVNHRDWDHHSRIYNEGNHYKLCKELDVALVLAPRRSRRAQAPDGRTLLDETHGRLLRRIRPHAGRAQPRRRVATTINTR